MFQRLIRFTDRMIHYFEVSFLTIALTCMTGALFLQVVCGFFEKSVPWAGEVARYLMIWVTCVGASAATRNRGHIAIEALVNRLRGKAHRAAEIFVVVFCVVMCAVACVVGAQFALDARDIGRTTLVLKLPLWIIYISLPLSSAFIALRFALTLFFTPEEPADEGGAAS